MDIEGLSALELTSLRGSIDRRLRELEGKDGKSLAELFSSGQRVDLIALAVMQSGIRCRTLDGRSVTLRNYEAGVAIGNLSLPPGFNGVLAWGRIDNRPYLRCLHGLGLCRWVLGDIQGARDVFERMLWLNPRDNQGVRFCLSAVTDGKSYEELERPMKEKA